MTTPRQNAELAARLDRLETTIQAVCQYNRGYNSLEVQEAFYDVVHELQDLGIDTKPPPIKRTITLTVNDREWVLPEPLSETPKHDQLVFYISDDGTVRACRWNNWAVLPTLYKEQRLHDTEADAQAWAEFDKWCRGGGV